MPKDFQEWGIQAEYDLETAEIMFSNGRYFYPETLSIIQKNYPREITEEILNKSKETLAWIKKHWRHPIF